MTKDIFKTINFKVGSKFELLGSEVELFGDISENDILRIVESKNKEYPMRDLEVIGSGSFSRVYTHNGYAIKHITRPNDLNNCNDIQAFKDLRDCKYIPKLYAIIDNDIIVMERINGQTIGDYRRSIRNGLETTIGEGFMNDFKDALVSIISMGYSPHDTHHDNVMVDYNNNIPRIIDLGWFFKHYKEFNSNEDMSKEDNYLTAMEWAGTVIEECIDYNESRREVLS